MKVSELSQTDQKRLEAIGVKKRLNKDDLVTLVALKLRMDEGLGSLGKDDVEKVCLELFDAITRIVHNDQSVLITGFGTFGKRDAPARMAHNPQTMEKVKAPAKRVPKFSPAMLFEQYLNGRPVPAKGPVVGKAPKGSGKATGDFVKTGVRKSRYVKKTK